jgi:hypothetical protein
VRKSTSIAIEGYPRSGNTFAVEAFRSSNPTAAIAHHLHSPVQMWRAARFGVPLIVLIRDPGEAVASTLVQAPYKRPEEAIRDWLTFYNSVPLEFCIIADFRDVVSDLSRTIRRVNAAYGTRFCEYINSPQEDEALFRAIDRDFLARFGPRGAVEFAAVVARPSNHRAPLRAAALAELERSSVAPLLLRARELYSTLSTRSRAGHEG